MATVMPNDELMRKAVRHVDEQLKPGGPSLASLVEEASVRFNLGPKDAEYLIKFFSDPERNG
ncbi:MAG: hypothetical protein D6E12_18125 [Desulfovibrio sp.]|nr:MAG: hypothetical protein D6E12_18125 [Desulfovibrio sp.]